MRNYRKTFSAKQNAPYTLTFTFCKLGKKTTISRVLADSDGQVLPWAAFQMILFLGFASLTIDIGHAMLVKRELQASADAAALAAAQTVSSGTYSAAATKYSAAAGFEECL